MINLSPDKAAVFAAVANVLRPGGRLALADIVSTEQLPEGVTCDASLWAACIGGANEALGNHPAVHGDVRCRLDAVVDIDQAGLGPDRARVADLTAGFAVEGRAIEDDFDRLPGVHLAGYPVRG